MRTKSALVNSMSGLVYQIVNMLIGFIVPRYIITIYGSEINGLTSNIQQYINILHLLQAGLIAASGCEMYKPIVLGDNETVGRIYYSDRKYFRRMSYVFLILAITVIPSMLIGKTENISQRELIISILIMAFNGYLAFKYCCCYDLMFSVHQKKYILYAALTIERAVYYIILAISLIFRPNYNLMYVGYLLGTIAKLLFLRYKFKRMYEKAIIQYKDQTGYKIRNQYYVLGEQIVFRIMDSVPILIVTKIYSLSYASIYSIYIMVIAAFKSVFDIVQNALTPSFGDLYAMHEEEKEYVADVFDMIQSIYFFILNVVSICLSILFLSFVNIYVGKSQPLNYVCNEIALFISLQMIMYIFFTQYNMITNAAGLYKQFFKGNIAIGLGGIVISIICAEINFQLVYVGITIYYLSAMFQRFLLIRRKIIPLNVKCIARPIITMLIYVMCFNLFSDTMFSVIGMKITSWIMNAVWIAMVGFAISLLLSFLIDRRQLIKIYEMFKVNMRKRGER